MPPVTAHDPMAITLPARSRARRTVSAASSVVTAPSMTATSNSSGIGTELVSCQYPRSIWPSTSMRWRSMFVMLIWQPKQLARPITTTRGARRSAVGDRFSLIYIDP